MSPKNEIAPFSLCPTSFLKIVPPSGHYFQQKNSPAFLFTHKSVKMTHSIGQTDWLVSKNYNKAVLIDKRIDLFKRTLQASEIRPYVLSENWFFIGDQNMCTIWHFILMRGSIDAEMIANSCKVAGIGRIGRCHNWIQIHELDAFSLSLWIVVT